MYLLTNLPIMCKLILSEPSTSVLCKVQKSSVATAIDTWSYKDQNSNAPMTTNSDFDFVDLCPATLEFSSDLSEPSCDINMSPLKSPATSDLPKAGIG